MIAARRVVVPVALTAALVAGTAASAGAAASHARPSVHVHSTSTHHIAAPARTQPGTAALRNTGARPVWVFKKIHADSTVLAGDLTKSSHSSGPGRLISDFALFDVVYGHRTIYLRLTRGTYYLADAELAKYTPSKIHTMTVSGSTANAALPRSSRVSITGRNTLIAPTSLPRRRYLHIVNHDAALQELLLLKVGGKVSTATIHKFLAAPSFAKLDSLRFRRVDLAAILTGHRSVYALQHSTPGRYVVLTLPFTSHTKRPRLRKGEARLLTVR